MSTKTTFKRIALVTVAALGFGVLTSVAPATATDAPFTFGTIASTPAVTNSAVTIVVPGTLAATVATGDTVTIAATLIAKPTGATGTLNAADVVMGSAANGTSGTSIGTMTNGATMTPTFATSSSRIAWTVGTVTANNTKTATFSSYFSFTPDKAGSYTVAVFTDGGAGVAQNKLVKSGDSVRYYTFTVADSSATKTSLTAPWSTNFSTYGTDGGVLKVQALDADGKVAQLTAGQQILVTIPSGLTLVKKTGTSATGSLTFTNTQYGLVQGDFDSTGTAFLNFTASAAGYYTVSTAIAGGSDAASSATIRFIAPTKVATVGGTFTNPDLSTIAAIEAGISGGDANAAVDAVDVSSSATSSTLIVYAAAGDISTATTTNYVHVSIGDVSSKIFGGNVAVNAGVVVGLATAVGASTATNGTAGKAYGTLSIPAALSTSTLTGGSRTFTATPQDTSLTTAPSTLSITVSGVASSATTLTYNTPVTTPILVATKTANAISVSCTDQFGAGKSNVTLTPSISGRNSAVVLPTLVTDAAGDASFTYTDASTSTTSLSDVVSISGCGTAATTTINYIGASTLAPSTMTITGGNYSAGVATGTITVNSIATATAGASATLVGMVATVKDSTGAVVVGYPVKFTVSGTGAAITSTSATAYTGATGTATGNVYAWIAGTYTVTATAGTLVSTATVTFGSETASSARVLSATAAGNVATAKVVDRFGNPVKNVVVYVSATGGANIGGAFATNGTTLRDGTVSFAVTGNGTLTFTTTDPSAASGSNPPNQTCALAGNATCALGSTAAVAFTASAAGTATTAETGVGASFAPAGVNSAVVQIDIADTASSAADAAAEATDAANAATDAANAAAEAADAATAAAQDAADAVAALSAQVATLISGLKAQLTALTNLVIKIQKKVKA